MGKRAKLLPGASRFWRRRKALIPGYSHASNKLGFAVAGIGEVLSLVADLFAQVVPNILRHRQENLNHFGIELAVRPVLDFLACGGIGLSRTIRAVGSDGVESIRNSEDAGPQGNVLALQTSGVAGAVEAFLVRI